MHTVTTWHQNNPRISAAGWGGAGDHGLTIPSSQSNFLSAGVAVGCGSDDGRGGRGLLDGGEAYVGGAVHVAGLALGAGTSTTSQLTEEEEEEGGVKWMHKVSAKPNSTTNSGAARSESSRVVDDPIR